MARAVHLMIHGRVQGVGFRYHCRRQAQLGGITGWVCNLESGEVEVVAEGEDGAVRRLIEWCGPGPLSAHVARCEILEVAPQGCWTSFEAVS